MAEASKTKKLSIWAWGVSLIQLYLETYFINHFIISRDNIVVYFMSLIFNCLIFIYNDFDKISKHRVKGNTRIFPYIKHFLGYNLF